MKRATTLPFMRLYLVDYRRDTQHLDTEQHGAYLLILMSYWEQQGPLPELAIKRASGLSDEKWSEHRELLASFFTVKKNHWHHKRVDAELGDVHDKSNERREAGRRGGKKTQEKIKKQAELQAELQAKNKLSLTEIEYREELPTVVSLNRKKLPKKESELLCARERVWTLETEIKKIKEVDQTEHQQ